MSDISIFAVGIYTVGLVLGYRAASVLIVT